MSGQIIILMKEEKHSASVRSLVKSRVEGVSTTLLKNLKQLFQITVTMKDILVLSDELVDDSWIAALPVARKMGGVILISFQTGENVVTQEMADKYKVDAFFKAPFKSEDLLKGLTSLNDRLNPIDSLDNVTPIIKELGEYYEKMDEKNYYELFSISKKSDKLVIKRAYVMLARKFHPDKFRKESEDAQSKAYDITKRINEAYSVLNHPNRRVVYDKLLHDKPSEKRFDFHMKVSYNENPEDTIKNDKVRKMVTLAQEAMELKEYKQAITQLKMARSLERGNTYIEELLAAAEKAYANILHVVD